MYLDLDRYFVMWLERLEILATFNFEQKFNITNKPGPELPSPSP